MLTERHYPLFLTHSELDQYLARGWYRMNQMIFTCHFIYFNEGIYSPVWIRLPLGGFQFKKRLSKLIRNNEKDFRIETQPAKIDSQKEKLFQAYKSHFDGQLADSLHDALMDNTSINIYDTEEICVYKDNQLIAVSFFDKGAESLASILGIYDPNYAKFSLGFYTMLKEISWGVEHGKKYYYPGYFIPGRPRFDYKLRIGPVEFYDPKQKGWREIHDFDIAGTPINILQKKLIKIHHFLTSEGIQIQKVFYPLFEEELLEYKGKHFMKVPVFLSCFHRDDNLFPLILEYDLIKECYRLSRFHAVESLLSLYTTELADRYQCDLCCLSFLYRDINILESKHFEDIKAEIMRYGH